jgi:uncharacterized OB-fold protein
VANQIPMVDYLVLGDDPHLVANECSGCGATYFDRRNACAACGGREFERRALGSRGTVRAFTIVQRAAKGVPAPYVSAVVDLDGGGRVKSNIVNVEPTPDKVSLGMDVQLTTYVTATDDDGNEAVAFGYEPA